MSFFEQELIRDELEEMTSLYQTLAKMMYGPDGKTEETRKECLDKLERLVELQELLYFRAKYSSDKEAEEFVEMIRASAIFLGVPSHVDVSQIFIQMKDVIAAANEGLDKSV
jgi:hypothetical protein